MSDTLKQMLDYMFASTGTDYVIVAGYLVHDLKKISQQQRTSAMVEEKNNNYNVAQTSERKTRKRFYWSKYTGAATKCYHDILAERNIKGYAPPTISDSRENLHSVLFSSYKKFYGNVSHLETELHASITSDINHWIDKYRDSYEKVHAPIFQPVKEWADKDIENFVRYYLHNRAVSNAYRITDIVNTVKRYLATENSLTCSIYRTICYFSTDNVFLNDVRLSLNSYADTHGLLRLKL